MLVEIWKLISSAFATRTKNTDHHHEKDIMTTKMNHPKIILIDMKDDDKDALISKGFNVQNGTFGAIFKVEKADAAHYVPLCARLPNFMEQEIIIIDLAASDASKAVPGEKLVSDGEDDWWASCKNGEIDPRPRAMKAVSGDTANILAHGGSVIVFAKPRIQQDIELTRIYQRRLMNGPAINADNWSFMPNLSEFEFHISASHGNEIFTPNQSNTISKLLNKYLDKSEYHCTIEPSERIKERWLTLAENKYGKPVAGAYLANSDPSGWVFIFPRINERPEFISRFVSELLPEICPRVFPEAKENNWIHRPEYELPEVVKIDQEIKDIEEQAIRDIATAQTKITETYERLGHLHDLLTGTDSTLVDAIKKSLHVLGFNKITDVDELRAARGENTKREDLWIEDESPLVLVEVKGIGGNPKEEDSLAVMKYIFPRAKELKRIDIRGLAIINHQRHIPAADRDRRPFQDDVITTAIQQDISLLTGWTLYKITKNFMANQWKHEYIRPIFYKNGVIECIPDHYEYIGVVEEYFAKPNAITLKLENQSLSVGEKIALEFPIDLVEIEIPSLQLNGQTIQTAEPGNWIGTVAEVSGNQITKGIKIFKVIR